MRADVIVEGTANTDTKSYPYHLDTILPYPVIVHGPIDPGATVRIFELLTNAAAKREAEEEAEAKIERTSQEDEPNDDEKS